MSITTGFAEVNNSRLYYEITGVGDPIVLINAGGLDRRMWDAQFERFAQQYQVIRYDVRGIDQSGARIHPFSHMNDLFELLKFLELDQVILIGASFGGGLAIDFTLLHPEMVSALIVVGPALSGYELSENNKQRMKAFATAAHQQGVEKTIELLLDDPYLIPAPTNPLAQQQYRENSLDNTQVWTEAPVPQYPSPPSAIDRLSEIEAPTLIIIGELDHPDMHQIAHLLR